MHDKHDEDGAPHIGRELQPSRLYDDRLAGATAWTPLTRPRASFSTHRLKILTPQRAEFRATRGLVLFCLLFVVLGASTALARVATLARTGVWNLNPFATIMLASRLAYAVFGAVMFYTVGSPIVCDKRTGYIFRPRSGLGIGLSGSSCELSRIYAVQLIRRASQHGGCELNLALADGGRRNVMTYTNDETARKDAVAFAAFLGKPCWDAL